MNLISLPSLDLKGYGGTWGNGRLSVVDPKTKHTIIDGRLSRVVNSRKLYEVDAVEPLVAVVSARSQNKPVDLEMWH